MRASEYDLPFYTLMLAVAISEELSTDELFVLSAAITDLGEMLETIAIQRERIFKIP